MGCFEGLGVGLRVGYCVDQSLDCDLYERGREMNSEMSAKALRRSSLPQGLSYQLGLVSQFLQELFAEVNYHIEQGLGSFHGIPSFLHSHNWTFCSYYHHR